MSVINTWDRVDIQHPHCFGFLYYGTKLSYSLFPLFMELVVLSVLISNNLFWASLSRIILKKKINKI